MDSLQYSYDSTGCQLTTCPFLYTAALNTGTDTLSGNSFGR